MESKKAGEIMYFVAFELSGYSFEYQITEKEYIDSLNWLQTIADNSPQDLEYKEGWYRNGFAHAMFKIGDSIIILSMDVDSSKRARRAVARALDNQRAKRGGAPGGHSRG
jgi:hypothetical protein